MKIKVRVHQHDYRFLYHLAQEDGSTEFCDYFSALAYEAMELHPDYRFCRECTHGVVPTIVTRPKKYVPNAFFCTESTTQPTEQCHDCGHQTITLEEHLDTVECCTKWKARMRALLAVERAFPKRGKDEPYGTEPAPDVELVVKAAKNGAA